MRKELVETHEVPVTHAAGRRGGAGGGGVVVRRESARDVARERQGAHDLEERVAPSARGGWLARRARAGPRAASGSPRGSRGGDPRNRDGRRRHRRRGREWREVGSRRVFVFGGAVRHTIKTMTNRGCRRRACRAAALVARAPHAMRASTFAAPSGASRPIRARASRRRVSGRAPLAASSLDRRVAADDEVRLVEFYSGSGMMRWALDRALESEGSGRRARGLAAVDNSEVANAVYAANFPDDPVGPLRRNIEHLTAADLDAPPFANADVWTLSPPCQPFTRKGKELHGDDPRAASFLHLLRLFPTLREPPRRVLVENVVGFETSATRDALVAALDARGYARREYLVSPRHLGVPYVRDRYYMLAKAPGLRFRDQDVPGSIPVRGGASRRRVLAEYLEAGDPGAECSDPSLWVPTATARKYWRWLNVVTPASASCQCFTAGYGKTVYGGCVLASNRSRRLPSASRRTSPRDGFDSRARPKKTTRASFGISVRGRLPTCTDSTSRSRFRPS